MNRIPNLVSAVCLAAVCMSCGTHEARAAREPPGPPVNPLSPLQNAIAVQDDVTVALFARLTKGMTPPQTVTITYYYHDNDHVETVLETLTDASVQVSASGFVYAAPRALPAQATRDHIKMADSAKVTIGSGVYPIDLGHAAGIISNLERGPYYAQYPPCPDCLLYFLCHCLKTLYGVDPIVPYCPKRNELYGTCTAPDL